MAKVPRLNTQQSVPQMQSVGRQRVNVPVEAFGGGAAARGLASAGAGVANLGKGIQDVGDRQEAELAAKEAAAAKKASDLQKIADDNYLLDYETQQQNRTAQIKSKQGVNATSALNEYDGGSKALQDKILEKYPPGPARDALLLKMKQSDLSRRNSMATHQNTEMKKAKRENTVTSGNKLQSKMSQSADTLRNMETVKEWASQFNSDTQNYINNLANEGVPLEKIKERVAERRKQGAIEASKNMIGDIGNQTENAPEIETEIVKKKLEQLIPDLGADKVRQLQKDADSELKYIQGKAKEEKQKLDNAELGLYTKELVDPDISDIDRQKKRDNFLDRRPDLASSINSIFNATKKVTTLTTEVALDKELQETENTEKFKASLMDKLKNDEISAKTYEEKIKEADTKMEVRKKSVWNEGILRMDRIIKGQFAPDSEQAKVGKGELKGTTGFFGISDVKLKKETIDKWKNLKEMAFDPNVTYRELQEIQDAVFFEPEAKMQAKEIEERLYEGEMMLRRASLRPGTQDLKQSNVDPFTKGKTLTDEELDAELIKVFQLSDEEIKKLSGK